MVVRPAMICVCFYKRLSLIRMLNMETPGRRETSRQQGSFMDELKDIQRVGVTEENAKTADRLGVMGGRQDKKHTVEENQQLVITNY